MLELGTLLNVPLMACIDVMPDTIVAGIRTRDEREYLTKFRKPQLWEIANYQQKLNGIGASITCLVCHLYGSREDTEKAFAKLINLKPDYAERPPQHILETPDVKL